jgi:hypothetical protein
MKMILTGLAIAVSTITAFAQTERTSALFKTLYTEDSLLFNIGYNTCDISQFENLVSDDFEFYHDKAGTTLSKAAFITGIRDGLCKLPYQPKRVLIENSLEVYPLKKNDTLYGAVQTGQHRFYAIEKGKPERLTSTAKFTHIWLLENGVWKLSRSFSYDHQEPK